MGWEVFAAEVNILQCNEGEEQYAYLWGDDEQAGEMLPHR